MGKRTYGGNWRSVQWFVETVMPREHMVACVDLDSVLLYHRSQDVCRRLGRVLGHGRRLVNLLKRKGYHVVVLTSRPMEQLWEIRGHLLKHGFGIERVTNIKPVADCYFDDKAFRISKNWE